MDNNRSGRGGGNYFYNIVFSIIYGVFFALSLGFEKITAVTFLSGLLGLLAINAIIYLVNLLAFENKPVRFILNLAVLVLFCALNGYYITTHHHFDYAILAGNFAESFYPGSLGLIFKSLGTFAIAVMLLAAVLFMLFESKFAVRKEDETFQKKRLILPAAVVLYAVILLIPMPIGDRLTLFVKSAYSYHAFSLPPVGDLPVASAPAMGNASNSLQKAAVNADPPHIFLIMIESFNSKVIGKRSESGQEYTPYFNRLRQEGLYIEDFYANSIQTCKGQFATMMSVIPSIKGKAFKIYKNNNFRSIAQVLSDFNYETIFFQAYEDLAFDNTGTFVRKNGYNTVTSVYEYLTPEEIKQVWGWGPEDRVLYERFFDFLDMKMAKERKGKPIFATLATVINHRDFEEVPKNKRHIFPKPIRLFERFANSIHLSDTQLQYFFENLEERDYLKNSVVIITADHSFPLGDHGIRDNETGFYEESFRIPFVMIWKGHIRAETIKNHPYSQLDIAPTLLDIVGGLESTPHHFAGQSMLRRSEEQHDIILIQPYNGKYVGVVDYPFKFVKSLEYGGIYLFDLEKDPEEINNLVGAPGVIAKVQEMGKKLQPIYENERLLETNALLTQRVIPASTADAKLPETEIRSKGYSGAAIK